MLAFDNGDTLHGTYPAVITQGEAVVGPLNRLKLDAWTVHWDFFYGTERMRELASKMNHPLLACNCFCERTNENLFPPTAVFDRGSIKVDVIGIAAVLIDQAFPDKLSQGVRFTMGRDELPHHIDRAGNLISTTDPMNKVWRQGFDAIGRLIRSTNPLNNSITCYGPTDVSNLPGLQPSQPHALHTQPCRLG